MTKINEKSNIEIQPKYGSCTPDKCFTNEIIRDNDVLQCRKCQRFVHYACSELPAYQIQICLQYKTRSFQCAKCITITPILLEKIKASKQRVRSDQTKKLESKEEYQKELNSVFNARLDGLEKKIKELSNKEDVHKEPKQVSYADITKDELKKQEVSIKSFIKEEKEEDRWMNSTKCNIIVHGLGENKCENKEEQQVGDKNYVEEEIRLRMGFKVNVVTAERIGIRKDEIFETNRWRPLKVVLRNEEQKKQIMASVHKIDDNWDFRISDDFSKKERDYQRVAS